MECFFIKIYKLNLKITLVFKSFPSIHNVSPAEFDKQGLTRFTKHPSYGTVIMKRMPGAGKLKG